MGANGAYNWRRLHECKDIYMYIGIIGSLSVDELAKCVNECELRQMHAFHDHKMMHFMIYKRSIQIYIIALHCYKN